tara:strand:+ start:826 stop:1068 length:243 start_codon:yes stop_codon:yes gene_type:complete
MNEIAQIIGIVRDITIICVLVFILVVFLPLSRRFLSMFASLDKLIAKLGDLSNGTQAAYNFGKIISFVAGIFGKKNKDLN